MEQEIRMKERKMTESKTKNRMKREEGTKISTINNIIIARERKKQDR